jgi:hypothetical protein
MKRNLVDPDLERGIWLIVTLVKMFFLLTVVGLGVAVHERIKRKK